MTKSSNAEAMRIPVDSHQTSHNTNRNWSPRYQDGKHKPKAKK